MLASKVAHMGANAALLLFLPRYLDVATYGLMVTVIGAQTFISRITLMGTDTGIIRLRTVPDLRSRTAEIARAGLVIILGLTAAVSVLALAGSPLIARLTKGEWPAWATAAVLAGTLGMSLVDFSYAFHLSNLNYRVATCLQGGTSVVRFLLTAASVLLFPGSPAVTFLTYAGVSTVSGAAQAMFLPRAQTRQPGLVRRLLGFSTWQAGSDILTVLSLYQGAFLLTFLGQKSAAGVFGLALTVTLGFFAIYLAFFQYIFPQMVRLRSPELMPAFTGNSMIAASGAAVACVPVAIVLAFIVPRLAGQEVYSGMKPALFWLTGAMLMWLVQSPLYAACLYLLRPNYVTISLIVRVGATAALGVAFIPKSGATGAAIAQFSGSALGTAVLAALVWAAMRGARAGLRLHGSEQPEPARSAAA